MLATFTVNSTGTDRDSYHDDGICDTANNPLTDPPTPASGICTLRAAVDQSLDQASNDRIVFDIDVADDVIPRIESNSPLIAANGTLEVDGTTQAAGMVEIRRGSNSGVILAGDGGHTIRGLVITGASTGITISSDNNIVVGNIIGLDRDGAAHGNPTAGISIVGSGNQIGGIVPADRNVISGNGSAIRIQNSGEFLSNNNIIVGNFIGTDATGTIVDPDGTPNTGDELGNLEGIVIFSGNGNRIGGLTAAERNVISGNQRAGVDLNGPFDKSTIVEDTLIQGNHIGTDVTGTVALGNGGRGVEASIAANTTISGNVISANQQSGINLGSDVTGTTITGNKIGTDATGTVIDPDGVPNSGDEFGNILNGIILFPFFAETVNTNNIVGGPNPEDANLISGNAVGVQVYNGADRNTIEGNLIGTNAAGSAPLPNGKGIEVLFSSRTVIAGNTISGNSTGLEIGGSTATDNLVVNNRIGVNGQVGSGTPGDTPLANEIGILINDSPGNCIGGVFPVPAGATIICAIPSGTPPIAGNVISGNSTYGVKIVNANAAGNVVQGNKIGTDAAGQVSDPDGVPGSGDELGNGYDGVSLEFAAHDNIIGGTVASKRNIISGNLGDGVLIVGADENEALNNRVIGNYIGTNVDGTLPLPNLFRGVHIDQHSVGNIIGGTTVGERNVISGNLNDGVIIALKTATENLVIGNFIGVAADGITRLGNEGNGVFIFDSPFNEIGGMAEEERNVISANGQAGILIQENEARGNLVRGNFIGTSHEGLVVDPDGALDSGDELGNLIGVIIENAPDNEIGPPFSPVANNNGRNVIAGNGDGIFIAGIEATGNLIGGNLIGMDLAGKPGSTVSTGVTLFGVSNNIIGGRTTNGAIVPGNVISRNDVGIYIANNDAEIATQNVVAGNKIGTDEFGDPLSGEHGNVTAGIIIDDASGNFIGQDTGADVPCDPENFAPGNTIAGNFGPGVIVEGDNATQNIIRCNSIYANSKVGIDLGRDGITLNDPMDVDASPNELQNYPIISVYEHVEDDIRIAGTLNAKPDTPYRIDFYATDTSNVEKLVHAVQGQRYIGTLVVTTDENGYVNFRTDHFALDPITDSEVITATATDPQKNTSEFSNFTPDSNAPGRNYRTPVIFVPGFFASFSKSTPGVVDDGDYLHFLTTLGIHPDGLVEDPIGKGYDDMIATLQVAGYELGLNLFVAVNDWRLSVAPSGEATTKDGLIDGVTAAQLTDDTFEYGLDYLGYALKQAAEAWYVKHREPLSSVHIIAHSMGGVLSRSYIQSSAYGGEFNSSVRSDGPLALPTVANLTMLAVPNRGAAVTFPAWDDNFAGETSYRFVLSKTISHAWNKLKAGTPIGRGVHTISPSDFDFNSSDLEAEKVRFVRTYVKGIADLLPEYDGFASNFNPDSVLEFKNWLMADLNHNGEAHSSERVARNISIYGTSNETHTFVNQNTGPNWLLSPTLSSFTDYRLWVAGWSQVWYSDTDVDKNGDGTVPLQSLETLFIDGTTVDERAELVPFCNAGSCRTGHPTRPNDKITSGAVNHTSVVSNKDVQLRVLRDLGYPIDPFFIQTGSEIGGLAGVTDVAYPFLLVNLYVDPVGSLVVDGNGNRFGYTPETGVLTEIPGSMYIGGSDGIGWVYDNPVNGPLELHLTGLGEEHHVQVTTAFGGDVNGLEDSGLLGLGETKIIPIPTAAPTEREIAFVYATDTGYDPVVRVMDSFGTETAFLAYDASFQGGVRVAAGDVNGDGVRDILTGTGPGMESQIRAISGIDGSELFEFSPYAGFDGGIQIAPGDFDGDGKADVVTAIGDDGEPEIRTYSGADQELIHSFYAFDDDGGVYVAAGDFNGDGVDDIVVGAGAGREPHVKVFDGLSAEQIISFMAFDIDFDGGVRVATGDINGDGTPDIITGPGPGIAPLVKIFDGLIANEIDSFLAFEESFQGGVFVAGLELPENGGTDVIVSSGPGRIGEIKSFDGETRDELTSSRPFGSDFLGGIVVGGTVNSRTAAINLPPIDGQYNIFNDNGDIVVSLATGEEQFRAKYEKLDRIRINGATDTNDHLIVNLDDMDLPIIYDGGEGGNDSLQIEGGSQFTDVEYDFLNEADGTISISTPTLEQQVTFYDLEPIVDNLNVLNRRFVFPDTGNDIVLNTGDDADDAIWRIDSDNSEVVDFIQPAESLSVLFGNGDDRLTIDLNEIPNLDGEGGQNTVVLVGSGHDVDLTQLVNNGTRGIETIDITGDGNNTLTLDFQTVLDLSSSQTLTLLADLGDTVRIGDGWTLTGVEDAGDEAFRVLEQNGATLRMKGPGQWQNPVYHPDVNNDKRVDIFDLLAIINGMRAHEVGYLPSGQPTVGGLFVDVNADGRVNIVDGLGVLNEIRKRLAGEGEPERRDDVLDLLAWDQALNDRSTRRDRLFQSPILDETVDDLAVEDVLP